jgi:hypothetical protein
MLRCEIILRVFLRHSYRMVLAKHSAQDDRQLCQEIKQRALQDDAVNLPKLDSAMKRLHDASKRQVLPPSLPGKTRRDIRQLTYAALHHSRITIPAEEREQLGSLEPTPTINKLN